MKKAVSVATILDLELEPTIKEWLTRVNAHPELANIPLNDADRAAHLPKLFQDLTYRLRLAKDARLPISDAATAYGHRRRRQGYSADLLVEESRVFQVVTFRALQLYQDELDQAQLLLDVIVIADEVDLQLMEAVRAFETKIAQSAA